MCYRVSRDFADVDVIKEKVFNITKVNAKFEPKYNVTITQKLPVIIPGSRILDMYIWGLIPHWAKDKENQAKLANARSETLLEKPSFRESFKSKRCLILVSGFFEWDINKTPYYIKTKNQKIFALAGLFDEWKSETNEILRTCTVITCNPNKTIEKIHNRMPVILAPDDYETWLTTDNLEKAQQLLKPYNDNLLTSYKVSSKVNSYKNDSKDLLEPINKPDKKQKMLF